MDNNIEHKKEKLIAPKGRMRRLLENTLLVGISLCIALGIGEIILRIGGAGKPEISDPILEFRTVNRPGWDSRGWKNHAPLEQADIVAIGDSQTEGNNATVDDAWPQTLGRLASTSVYQMAMGGYGPVQYAELFDRAIPLRPKTVIVGFYLGNDLTEAYRLTYTLDHWKELRRTDFVAPNSVDDGQPGIDYRTVLSTGLKPDSWMYRVYDLRLWFRAHSVLYATLGNASRTLREQIGIAKTKGEKIADVAVFAEENPGLAYYEKTQGIETIMSPSYRLDTVSLSEPITKEGWRITQERFRIIREKAKANNINLVFVVIPTKEGVYLEYWKRTLGTIPPSFSLYDQKESELAATIKTFCDKELLTCVFPLPAMADQLQQNQQLYGKTLDGHPIAKGYYTIADSVYEYLKQHNLIQ